MRKSSWDEFEVEHTYAELNVTPGTPVTFSGFVRPGRIDDLLAVFTALGLSYVVELEDDGDTIVYRS